MADSDRLVSLAGFRRARRRAATGGKRILIVNCYFPEIREPVRLTHEIPNALAPVFLAGVFSPQLCKIRLYNEITDGFLEIFAPRLLDWRPDMVVLTGLTLTFDRMLHLSAYLRTARRDVVVVAGGAAVRALPRYSRRFFDYACLGDVEQLREVVEEAFGKEYLAESMSPRYDLAPWIGKRIAYVESSRNCNFRCSFCSLTAEGNGYKRMSVDDLSRQIVALGKGRGILFFQDNQFHAGDRGFLLERLELLKEMRAAGYFKHWHAFVTNAFLWDEENLALARESGCFSLFVGVESFDGVWLRGVKKMQNVRRSQIELIRSCLDAGILLQYGLVFDPSERRVGDVRREIEQICANAEIPPPLFVFMAIPFPGTPFFRDRYERGLILPGTKLRDLQGSTLSLKPLDGVEEVVRFIRTAKNFKGYRAKVFAHQARFLKRYSGKLGAVRTLVSGLSAVSLVAPWMVANPRTLLVPRGRRSHVSTTDRLDCVYTPCREVAPELRHFFQPTRCTVEDGALNAELAEDLLGLPTAAAADRSAAS